jgi:hypothetical protein
MRIGILPLILSASLMTATHAQEAPRTPATNSPERQAILKPALADVVGALGKPAQLDVSSLRVSGEWAFVYASIQSPGGQPIEYADTPFAEAAEAGMKSNVYAALLRGHATEWKLVTSVVGPTDMAWAPWAAQHGAPEAIFEVP